MKKREAIAEDLRKLGTGLMLAGIIGSALQGQVPVAGAMVAGLVGLVFVALGVAITPEDK